MPRSTQDAFSMVILDTPASYELPVNVHIPPGTAIEVVVEPEIINVIYSKQE